MKQLNVIITVISAIVIIFIIFLLIPIEPEVLYNETVIVEQGQSRAFSFEAEELDDIDVEVEANVQINLFLMTNDQYIDFTDSKEDGFSSISEGSAGNILKKSYTYTILTDDTYHVVVDNSGEVETGAATVGPIEAKVEIILS